MSIALCHPRFAGLPTALNCEMLNGGADFDLGHQLATEIWLKTIYQQD